MVRDENGVSPENQGKEHTAQLGRLQEPDHSKFLRKTVCQYTEQSFLKTSVRTLESSPSPARMKLQRLRRRPDGE